MIDTAAFAARCRGMFVQPTATLRDHAQPLPPWQIAAREHALPLAVASAAVSTLLNWAIPPWFLGVEPFGLSLDFVLLHLVMDTAANLFGILLVACVVMVFSRMCAGRPDFGASFVLAALAATPYCVGKALVPLPVIGPLAWFAGLIYSLVLLYRGGLPVLMIPAQNRAKHFALTLLSLLMIGMVAVMALGQWAQSVVGSAEWQ
ncbi:MAG: YIP1 family protein [Rhodospirillaceae bacterium]|nr:YIP1 family protein [Rhodospirillaceae bacterium]